MYQRVLNLLPLLKKKSIFLFGPRGTGKTTLIRHTISDATMIDLLESKTFRYYLRNWEEISYQSIANDCGVSPNTIKNYIQILEDTLIAFQLNGFTRTKKRKAISRSKIYFFDVGVINALTHRGIILERWELFGKAFEHFILLETRACISYARKDVTMRYWRSTSKFEVDLILNDQWAIEIKGANAISEKHLKGLRALKEEGVIRNFAVVSCDPHERITRDGISIFPWEVFLERLWRGEFFDKN